MKFEQFIFNLTFSSLYKYIVCYVSNSSFSNRSCLFCSAAFQIIVVTKIIRTKPEKLFRFKNVFKNLGYVIHTGTCTNGNLERIFDVVGLSKILRLAVLLKFLCIVKLSIKKGISFTWKKSGTMLKIQIFSFFRGGGGGWRFITPTSTELETSSHEK